jgi:Zn-dependent peptidase ImmA (M78 family)
MKRKDIERRAEELLRDHGMLDMVVDPVRLANDAGLRVFNAKFGNDNIHGLIALRGGQARIYVNADDRPVRKRFTIAHEIGHFVLHLAGGEGRFVDDADNFRIPVEPDAVWTTERRQEWEANVFASALLMNESLVRKMWPQISDPEGMARWFQVSETAMSIRLASLGLEP